MEGLGPSKDFKTLLDLLSKIAFRQPIVWQNGDDQIVAFVLFVREHQKQSNTSSCVAATPHKFGVLLKTG
jgi:hypothetical protein